jgi:hypothetical protein
MSSHQRRGNGCHSPFYRDNYWVVTTDGLASSRVMEAPDADKAKARRAIFILYACMIGGVALPIILYFALR